MHGIAMKLLQGLSTKVKHSILIMHDTHQMARPSCRCHRLMKELLPSAT